MSLYPSFLIVVIVSILRCNAEQRYICDDKENDKPVCECKVSECYFKLVIEHAQVIM